MGLAGLLLLLVALDALTVHHFFLFQRALRLELFDGIGFLGKDAVANLAIFEPILMLGVGKGHFALFTTENVDLVSPWSAALAAAMGRMAIKAVVMAIAKILRFM